MKQLTMYYDKFNLTLNEEDVLACSHAGDNYDDCNAVSKKEYVIEQLSDITTETIVEQLLNVGIYIEDEKDRQEIVELIIWDAACYLREDITGSLNN